ncbi:hypothetical protein M0P48_04230, partial [Candidatus Gracilibacteria bacterium]|nr:hypothetical protein [Candidatus Gracilibacteria bacterium]
MDPTNTSTAVIPEEKTKDLNKNVFSGADSQNLETPDWLKDASQVSGGNKINYEDVKVEIKADKPTFTELGENPDSVIEVTPSFEVVQKIDFEAAAKLEQAGYDPKTGRKIEKNLLSNAFSAVTSGVEKLAGGAAKTVEPEKADIAEPAVAPVVVDPAKKKSVFDSLKSLFVSNDAKQRAEMFKASQADAAKSKMSNEERQRYIEAEKIYQQGLSAIKDLISPSAMEINYDSLRLDGL